MKRSCVAALVLSACLFTSSTTHAAFNKVDEVSFPFSRLNGIAFDGTEWHIGESSSGRFHTFDSAFNFLRTTTIPGVRELLAVTYDPNSNHLFVGEWDGTVREITFTGATVQSFHVPAVSSLAYDQSDDTLWLAAYNAGVSHLTRTGEQIGHFSTVPRITGLAIDSSSQTLLVLNDDDLLYEYTKSGGVFTVKPLIATDQVEGNGYGLAYDPSLGRLYVTTNEFVGGSVTIFEDALRIVPEPSTLMMASTSVLALFVYGKRRKAV